MQALFNHALNILIPLNKQILYFSLTVQLANEKEDNLDIEIKK